MTHALVLLLLAADPARPRIGVSDFSAEKNTQAISSAANSLVANELQRLGAFEVSTAEQLRALLGYERQNQLLGCTSDSCSSNVGAAINLDYLVTGQLTSLKGAAGSNSYSLDLQLIAVKTGRREHGESITGTSEQQLIMNVTPALVKLVQSILKERSGSLVLTSSEPGSTVKVDDIVMGVTPLDGRVSIAGGPHIVAVEKDGYVTWQKEVRVAPGALVEETAKLAPSPDTIAAWESKQSKLRFGAIGTTGLAVGGIAAGVVFQVLAAKQYVEFDKARSNLIAGNEVVGEVNQRTLAGNQRATITTFQTISWVGISVGAASAVAATVLWVLSDDPGKYRAYREVSIAFMPILTGGGGGGGYATLSGSF